MHFTQGLFRIVCKSLFNKDIIINHVQQNFFKFNLKLSPSPYQQFVSFTQYSTMAVEGPCHFNYGSFTVDLVPALGDNYMYVVIDKASNIAAVIDPVEPDKVLDVVKKSNADLKFVWTTHHHWDHAGGNVKLVEKVPHVEVFGGGKNVDAVTRIVKDNEQFTLGNETFITAIHTPCHTTTSICYNVHNKDRSSDVVFTGDTLFIAGAGKFFEGNGADMNNNLNVKLAKLPDKCEVFCGHEYTVSNLQFAQHMEPDNVKIRDKLTWAKNKRSGMNPTVPSTIGDEKQTNPFMRIMQPEFNALASQCNGNLDKVMDLVREKKNAFKG
uniref:hydroxyacylglutathione hydrolase n=2 Tax=Cacopsylla melanoneura TaxID=428564 RepID=A0A8D8RBL6_9HEMI